MKNFDLMRPQEVYALVLKQREFDGKSFYEKYNKQFVEIGCPICGGEGKFAFEKYGFSHKICEGCKTLFCSPRPPDSLLTIYYNNYKAPRMWTDLLLKADTERKVLQHKPRVEKIISIIKKQRGLNGGIALDLGAGSGAFSVCLQKTGFFKEVIAMDLSEDCVTACKKQGLKASLGTITDVDDASVNLICINDLIEHLFDPLSFLKECFRVLRKDGYIFSVTPNGEGFDFKIMKEKTRNVTPPEHLTYFNPHSLGRILTQVGFKALLIETPGILDVEIILKEKLSGFSLKHKNEYLDYLLEQNDDVLRNFQKFLSENKLSSHLLILAQKSQEQSI